MNPMRLYRLDTVIASDTGHERHQPSLTIARLFTDPPVLDTEYATDGMHSYVPDLETTQATSHAPTDTTAAVTTDADGDGGGDDDDVETQIAIKGQEVLDALKANPALAGEFQGITIEYLNQISLIRQLGLDRATTDAARDGPAGAAIQLLVFPPGVGPYSTLFLPRTLPDPRRGGRHMPAPWTSLGARAARTTASERLATALEGMHLLTKFRAQELQTKGGTPSERSVPQPAQRILTTRVRVEYRHRVFMAHVEGWTCVGLTTAGPTGIDTKAQLQEKQHQ